MLIRMMRLGPACLAALTVTVLIGLAAPPRAAAAANVEYGLTDDAWLLDGSGTLESKLARLDALGVRVVRFTLRWDQIASSKPGSPTDPSDAAYDWTADDAVLDGLRAHGIDVVLQLVGAPTWANGGLPANYAPSSADDVRGIRDSRGPQILVGAPLADLERAEPGAVGSVRQRLRCTPRGCSIPRMLAIHTVIPGAQVAGGGTAPRGSSRRRLTCRLAARHARGARKAGRVRAQPVSARPEARDAAQRRLRAMHDDHDGDDRQAGRSRDAELPARPHLADGVRLPEQSARPPARHLADLPGALRRRKAPTSPTAPRASISSSTFCTATSRRSPASRAGS